MNILFAFLESKWKNTGKTRKNHPEQEKQKTMWSTSEEATDTQ